MDDRFFQLGLGEAVLLREPQVPDKLLGAARGDQAGHGDQAAVPFGQLGSFPDVTEEDVIGELDEFGAKSPTARWAGVCSVMVIFPLGRVRDESRFRSADGIGQESETFLTATVGALVAVREGLLVHG